jgi:FtsP/CotA-like multicopper oxidase with cupredoxin domain
MGSGEGFATQTDGLHRAKATEQVELHHGDRYELRISAVAKEIAGTTIRMLAYNGSIPGPTLRVRQGSELLVDVVNETDMETTVHWHGLRLENRYDGVPHDTQAPIPPGGTYTHRLTFPDAGLFWYHPHMREDYAQELGLQGNIVVDPVDASYWPPVDRELVLTLDDILIEDGEIAAFDPHHSNFTAMGRFGNVLLIAGEAEQRIEAKAGEVVRLGMTNTANTRVFKVALPGVRMKLVGNDAGRYEREEWVDDVVIAPSERAIVDICFDRAGAFTLQHTTPQRVYELATISVGSPTRTQAGEVFEDLRTNADMVAERRRVAGYLAAPPDKTLALVAEMDVEEPVGDGPVVYACPMHSDVISGEPGSCPQCGMKLMPVASVFTCPMHPDVMSSQPGHCPQCGMKLMPSLAIPSSSAHEPDAHSSHEHQDHGDGNADGIEWEDDMVEVNRTTTPANMRWKLVDRETGKANADIDWAFAEGDQVKIRIVNEMESDHPMHHPFHIHGERFLVLARDGEPEPNLVWKDTVLIRTGEIVDILMDASNPGSWMAHCHIAEHMEAGMMFTFQVRASS